LVGATSQMKNIVFLEVLAKFIYLRLPHFNELLGKVRNIFCKILILYFWL